jgi:hypothetical protein
MDLSSLLITKEVGMLAAGIVALLWGVGQIPTRGGPLARRAWWRRVLPMLPLVLGVIGAFMPGVVPAEMPVVETWGANVLIGLWAGLVAGQGHTIIKRLAVAKLAPKEGTP